MQALLNEIINCIEKMGVEDVLLDPLALKVYFTYQGEDWVLILQPLERR